MNRHSITVAGLWVIFTIAGVALVHSPPGPQTRPLGAGGFLGVEATVKYWHFVDVAWVFIYPTLYLLG